MIRFARKFGVLISVNHALMLAYRAEIYLWVLANVLPFFMMGLWSQAASTLGSFSMDAHGYRRYFLAVFIVRQFTMVWMIHEFEYNVVEGRLSNYLLRPMHPLWNYVSAHYGEQLARFPFAVLIVAGFIFVCPDVLSPAPDWRNFALAFPVIFSAFALRFVLQYCFAMLSFWFERAAEIERLSFLPYLFFSGAMIPLAEIKGPLRTVIEASPFPYMVSFPVRILTGQIAGGEILQGLAIMAAWFIGLFGLSTILWRRGLRRYAGQGA